MINSSLEKQEHDEQREIEYSNSDLIIRARLDRADIQMLVKLVEGLGHLGVVTTTDKQNGEVIIQTTKDCWTELRVVIENMPISITIHD